MTYHLSGARFGGGATFDVPAKKREAATVIVVAIDLCERRRVTAYMSGYVSTGPVPYGCLPWVYPGYLRLGAKEKGGYFGDRMPVQVGPVLVLHACFQSGGGSGRAWLHCKLWSSAAGMPLFIHPTPFLSRVACRVCRAG